MSGHAANSASDTSHLAGSAYLTKACPIDVRILRQIFDRYDADGDGILDPKELYQALVEQSIITNFDDLDKDGNGSVDFEEFAVLSTVMGRHTHPIFLKALDTLQMTMSSGAPPEIEPVDPETIKKVAAKSWRKLASLRDWDDLAIAQAFRRVDANRDGYLTAEEVKSAVKHMCPSLNTKDVLMMIATADTNNDGFISYEEFKYMLLFDNERDIQMSLHRFGDTIKTDTLKAYDSTGRPVQHGTSIARFGMEYSPFTKNF